MNISEIIERVEVITKDLPEPKTVCWLEHDEHGDSGCEFCPDCADKIYAQLINGEIVKELQTWTNSTEKNLRLCMSAGYYDEDRKVICELCGCEIA